MKKWNFWQSFVPPFACIVSLACGYLIGGTPPMANGYRPAANNPAGGALLATKNYPVVDPSQANTPRLDIPSDNNYPYGYVRNLAPVVLTAANLRSATQVVAISRPSLVKITGMSGVAAGPGAAAAVDAPTLAVTARGGYGPTGPVPDQFFLGPDDLCIRANRGYLYLPHPGTWSLSYKASGEVVAANPWGVYAVLYEGVPPTVMSGILSGPPTISVSYALVLGASESALIQLGGGFGVNDLSFRALRLACTSAGFTYSIGGTTGNMPISSSTAATDIPSDLLGMGFVRVNAPVAGGTVFVVATLDP